MNLKEQVSDCLETKEKIDNLKMQFKTKKRNLFNYISTNLFDTKYEVKKLEVYKTISSNRKIARIQQSIFYIDLNVLEGFKKIEEVVMLFNYPEGRGPFLLRKYTLQEIESGLEIYIREEFEKASIILKNDNQCFISYIKYVVKIAGIEFEFTKDYKRYIMESLD